MSLILEADAFYRTAETIAPERYRIPDRPAQTFSVAVTKLGRDLGEDAEYPPWDRLVSTARAARWRGATEPVPFTSRFSTAKQPLTELLALIPGLTNAVDSHRQLLLSELACSAESYLASGNQHYADAVRECLHDGDPARTCLIAVGQRAAEAITGWFAEEAGEPTQVLVPRDFLASRQVWDLAIIAGAGSWLPPQLLTTPRAEYTTLVHPDWVQDSQQFTGAFGDQASCIVRARIHEPRPQTSLFQPSDNTEPAVEIPPQPNWTAFAAALPGTSRDDETVEARLAVLSGGYGALLPVDGDRIRGLDPAASPGERVLNLKIGCVAPGSILLLREGGTEASLMRQLAGRQLGPRLAEIQQLQEDWKRRLKLRIGERGKSAIERELRARGAQTVNLVYWASAESIRPRRDSDFDVLLRYLGITDTGPYLTASRSLWEAHDKAGSALTRSLESQVERVDLSPLTDRGVLQLHPEGTPQGATMTAFRVVALSEGAYEVAQRAARRPFEIRGTEWLE